MNLIRVGLSFILGLCITQNNFVLAQEASPELPTQAAIPQTATVETSGQAGKTAVSTETPAIETQAVMEIKRLDTKEPLYSLELRDVEIGDLFRVLAHDYQLNLLVDKEVSGRITASLTNVSLEEALNSITESQNLKFEKKGSIIRISLNFITKAFTLEYIEARELLEPSAQAGSSTTSDTAANQAGTIYDLLSEKGKILLGKQPNSIIVIDYPTNIARLEEYLKEMDRKMTSRVFKLKYLKATEVVGGTSNTTSTSSSSATPAGTETSPSGSF
jgi:type II secretory pathway component HofQ